MLTDTEVRLPSNLIMQIEPGARLGSLDKQNTVYAAIRRSALSYQINS